MAGGREGGEGSILLFHEGRIFKSDLCNQPFASGSYFFVMALGVQS